jgi:alpha-beta hydrolase superfamily lysophospholipase
MTDVIASFDEPAGATPRGTLIVLPGRGETATSYQRFGKRLSFDNYKVRVVAVDLDDLDDTRESVEKLLADESLPSPKVLIGTDTGATLVSTLVGTPSAAVSAAAAVIAGVALADSRGVDSWEQEIEARSACPLHRTVLDGDDAFGRGGLNEPLPAVWDDLDRAVPAIPTLVLHGAADPVTPLEEAVAPYREGAGVVVRRINGGRHDVLNDIMHRSVAATIVLFLESLRLGSELPPILEPA